MLLVCVFLALCAAETLGVQNVHDFNDNLSGYQFMYHDKHNLLLTMHNDRCYFIPFPDSKESELVDTGSSKDHHGSPLRTTEESLVRHLLFNHSGDVIPSSLDAVRAKYQDILADFLCKDKHIFEIAFFGSDTTTTTRPQHPHNLCHGLPNGMHPYPGDCRRFIVCSDGIAFVEQCADGTVFQEKIPGCTFRSSVPECQRPQYPHNLCHGLPNGMHPYPGDCRRFIACSNGMAFVEQCADGTVFQEKIPGCTFHSSVPECQSN